MNIKFYIFLTLFLSLPIKALADAFVPDFATMLILQCEVTETILENGNFVSKSSYHRLFRIDEPFKKIYINKEPIDYVTLFNQNKIEFNLQSMTDDYIANSHSIIDRITGNYSAIGNITYDNQEFTPKQISATGICKILN
jgi:hypothetical protein